MAHGPQREFDRESSGASRRCEIVEAARSLYETRGLSHTTVKDIAEKVGVTRSLFYHYFENKNAVTEAVLDSYEHAQGHGRHGDAYHLAPLVESGGPGPGRTGSGPRTRVRPPTPWRV